MSRCPRLAAPSAALFALSLWAFAAAPSRAQTTAQLQTEIAALQAQVAALQQKTAALTVTTDSTRADKKTNTEMTLTGVNLHVVSGSGKTNGTVNGLGNVIIGYDEQRTGSGAVNTRTGSHCLVLGLGNNYSSYGGLVAGASNTVSGGFASVTGGAGNAASGMYAAVAGGRNNAASATYAAVGGGDGNAASASDAFLPLDADLTSLDTQIAAIQSTAATQGGSLAAMSKITGLFALATDSTRSDGKTNTELTLSGVNLHVVNGLGATNGEPNNPYDSDSPVVNGLGNLIIGYNETRANDYNTNNPNAPGTDSRTGSHNLIVGDENNYTSYGGILAGDFNTASAPFAGVTGGQSNTASGLYAGVTGGSFNTASGLYAGVTGGDGNTASGAVSSVSGGQANTASGAVSSVSGGEVNTASGNFASVSGGNGNTASGVNSSVSGGNGNTASGVNSSVSGGVNLTANGGYEFDQGNGEYDIWDGTGPTWAATTYSGH